MESGTKRKVFLQKVLKLERGTLTETHAVRELYIVNPLFRTNRHKRETHAPTAAHSDAPGTAPKHTGRAIGSVGDGGNKYMRQKELLYLDT